MLTGHGAVESLPGGSLCSWQGFGLCPFHTVALWAGLEGGFAFCRVVAEGHGVLLFLPGVQGLLHCWELVAALGNGILREKQVRWDLTGGLRVLGLGTW